MTFLQVNVIIMVVYTIWGLWSFLFHPFYQYFENKPYQFSKQFLCLLVFSLVVVGWIGNGMVIWAHLPQYIEHQEEIKQ